MHDIHEKTWFYPFLRNNILFRIHRAIRARIQLGIWRMPQFSLWKKLVLGGAMVGFVLFGQLLTSYAQNYDTLWQGEAGDSTQFIGRDSGIDYFQTALEYNPTEDAFVCRVTLSLGKNGSPSDSINLKAYGTSSTPTGGTLIGTSQTISGGTVSSTPTVTNFNFPNCFATVAGNKYYFVWGRTGSISATNYYNFEYKIGSTISANGKWWTTPNGTWGTNTENIEATIQGYQESIVIIPPNVNGTSTWFTVDCSAYSVWTSSTEAIACAGEKVLKGTLGFLFEPNTISGSTDYFLTSLDALKDVFPFNVFFNFNSLLQDEASVIATSNNTALVLPLWTGGPNLTILSSSTIATAVGTSTQATALAIQTALIWVLTGIAMIKMIL